MKTSVTLPRGGNDGVVQLADFTDETGAAQTGATVTFTITPLNGTAVAGCTAVSMPHVTPADANCFGATYRGYVPASAPLVVGRTYVGVVTATYAGKTGLFDLVVSVDAR